MVKLFNIFLIFQKQYSNSIKTQNDYLTITLSQSMQDPDLDLKELPSSCKQSSYKNDMSEQSPHQLEINIHRSIPQTVASSNASIQAYHNILTGIDKKQRSLEQLILELKSNQIYYNSNHGSELKNKKYLHQIRILSIKPTKHYQVVVIHAQLGPFSHSLKIYNTFHSSIFENKLLLFNGKSTNIYRIKFGQQHFIAKSIIFSCNQIKSQLKQKEFIDTVQEFFISKIMSALKIGPKLCQEFGFDIFLSTNEVFFFIEQCFPATIKEFTSGDGLSLKKSLQQMHSLSFLHRDIKPDNIMYSPSYEKFVLIDFGITEFKKQIHGQLSYTGFGGTYAYCTVEMKRLFKTHERGWVDLYLNDAYGLDLSIEEMVKNNINIKTNESQITIIKDEDYTLEEFLTLTYLKFYLFTVSLDKNYVFQKKIIIQQDHFSHVMTFLYEISLNEKIRQIYKKNLEQYAQDQDKFQDLRDVFSNKIYFESCKGKRKISPEEKKNIEVLQQFYEQIKYSYCLNAESSKISVKKLEEILFDAEKIHNLRQYQYEFLLTEYLNYERLEPKIPLEKKLNASMRYLEQKSEKSLKEYQKATIREVLDETIYHIIKSIPIKRKLDNFTDYIKALKNYVIFAIKMNQKVMQQIPDIIEEIDRNNNIILRQKIEYLLLILLVIKSLGCSAMKLNIYRLMIKISQIIKQKVTFYSLKAQSQMSPDMKICSIYRLCFKQFGIQRVLIQKCNEREIVRQLKQIKAQSQTTCLLVNYIEYNLLTKLQKLEGVYFERKQKQEMLIDQMENQKQINELFDAINKFYFYLNEIKMMKKFTEVYKNCIQIEQIYNDYFIFPRLFIILDQKDKYSNTVSNSIEQCCLKISSSLQVVQDNIVQFFFSLQLVLYLFTNWLQSKIQVPKPLKGIVQLSNQQIPNALLIYESFKQPIIYKGSSKLFYLELNWQNLKIKFPKKCHEMGYPQNIYQSIWTVYPQIESFHKIINIDRSDFIYEDHIFLLYFDIIQLKHQNGQESSKSIIKYLHQKKKLINEAFSIQNSRQSFFILSSLSLILYILNNEKDAYNLKEGLAIIYPIVQKKFYIQAIGSEFNKIIINSLVKLGQFENILSEVINCCKLYTYYLSDANIICLSRFFEQIMKNLRSAENKSLFYSQLKKKIAQIDLKKIPVFGIFLILCIRPFNRKLILKLIMNCLPHIKHNGRYFILANYYKEFMKMNSNEVSKKTKFLMRRDVRYPSLYTKNLTEMKRHLNCYDNLVSFSGVFRSKIQDKIIKLGKCCEVYSKNRMLHPLKEILNQQIFDEKLKQSYIKERQKNEE